MVEYKVLKYELNYFRHPKKSDTERVTYNSTTYVYVIKYNNKNH